MTTEDTEPAALKREEPLIVIASNRGPFTFTQEEDGEFSVQRGSGGLVTALGALAEQHDVLWIASALSEDDQAWARKHKGRVQTVEGVNLQFVIPDAEQYEQYYNVISNPLLWFIQHQLWDAIRNPSITQETWSAWHNGYVKINRLFAETIARTVKNIKRPIIILPQDYHLYLVPGFLRQALGDMADRVQIQPFIHIPWPSPDAWRILPTQMRSALLSGMLASDRVGFQTQADAFQFVQTCRFYLNNAHSHGSRSSITYKGRKIDAQTYPISVDVEKLQTMVNEQETRAYRAEVESFLSGRHLILRIDRVEPSKNILRGLEAFRTLLDTHPEHRGNVQMLALLVPSRMGVDEYQNYLSEIMAHAGLINAEYGDGFWEPVRIVLGNNYRRALAAMQLYDVLLVNPITDGMNLVAKEGTLVNQRDGVLVLSEHAGAFYELGEHALTVSPFDVYGTANILHDSLMMPTQERHQRAERMREQVQGASVKDWFRDQVADALRASNIHAKKVSTAPIPESSTSEPSLTASGVSSDSTPMPKA